MYTTGSISGYQVQNSFIQQEGNAQNHSQKENIKRIGQLCEYIKQNHPCKELKSLLQMEIVTSEKACSVIHRIHEISNRKLHISEATKPVEVTPENTNTGFFSFFSSPVTPHVKIHSELLSADQINELFSKNPTMTTLELVYCRFEQGAIDALAKQLETNQQITSINLNSSFLMVDSILPVLNALKNNTKIKLQTLSLSSCNMNFTTSPALAEILKNQKDNLEVFDFSFNFQSAPDSSSLCWVVYNVLATEEFPVLRKLDCGFTSAHEYGMKLLATFLGNTKSLKEINLTQVSQYTSPDDKGWFRIFDAMDGNEELQLESLNLGFNMINLGFEQLGSFLKKQTQLKELISYVPTGSSKTDHIVLDGLRQSESPLETLIYTGGRKCAEEFVQVFLEKKQTLTKVDVTCSGWNETNLQPLIQNYSEDVPTQLKAFCLRGGGVDPLSIGKSYSTLISLISNLSEMVVTNDLFAGEDDIGYLFQGLAEEKAPKIRKLEIYDCNISENSASFFYSMLKNQSELDQIHFYRGSYKQALFPSEGAFLDVVESLKLERTTSITDLALQGFPLTATAAQELSNCLGQLTALEKINIGYLDSVDEELLDQNMSVVLSGIKGKNINSLKLPGAQMGRESAEEISTLMKNNSELTTLVTGTKQGAAWIKKVKNFQEEDSLIPVLDQLKTGNTKLKTLDISNSVLSSEGHKTFIEAIAKQTSLEKMIFSELFTHNDQALAFAKSLLDWKGSLSFLDLSYCNKSLDQSMADLLGKVIEKQRYFFNHITTYGSFPDGYDTVFQDPIGANPWTDRLQ